MRKASQQELAAQHPSCLLLAAPDAAGGEGSLQPYVSSAFYLLECLVFVALVYLIYLLVTGCF